MRKFLVFVLAVMLLCTAGALAQEAESGWENILLLGGDARNMEKYDRTDTMIVLSFNRDESLVKLTSIMRDTWVSIPGHGNNKINAANVFGGPELVIETVNTNFGLDIQDYVMINMADLVQIVDLLGGVDVDVTESERQKINSYIENYFNEVRGASSYAGETYLAKTGVVHLNGLQAMSYCRDRYSDSDYNRVMRQQEVLLGLARNAQDMEVDALMDVAGQISELVMTNMEREELENLAMAFMVVMVEDIEQNRIPADGTFQSGMFDGVWMIRPDLEQNRALLDAFIYGE